MWPFTRGDPHPQSATVDAEDVATIESSVEDAGALVGVTPYREKGGVEVSRWFLRAMFTVNRDGVGQRKNVSKPMTLEMHFNQRAGELTFRYATADDAHRNKLRSNLRSCYFDADITELRPTFIDVSPGQYVSAAYLTHREDGAFDDLLPINHYVINPDDFAHDPYDAITDAMVGPQTPGEGESDVVVQVVMRPAISTAGSKRLNWWNGCRSKAKELRKGQESFRWSAFLDAFDPDGDGKVSFTKRKDPTKREKKVADLIADQEYQLGYEVAVRVVAVADEADVAEQRVRETCEQFNTFYNGDFGQGLEPKYISTKALPEFIETMAARRFVDNHAMALSIDETTGLGHLPTDLTTSEVPFARRRGDHGAPTSTPGGDDFLDPNELPEFSAEPADELPGSDGESTGIVGKDVSPDPDRSTPDADETDTDDEVRAPWE